MQKLSKILMLIGLATLTALVIVWFRVDAIAQHSLETNLTRILGVNTTISSLSIQKLSGQAQIRGLSIANPEGYSADQIFQVQDIQVAFQPLSFLGQTLKVQSLGLENIGVNFEQRLKDNNILELVNSVKARQRQSQQPRLMRAQISFKGKRFEIQTVNLNQIQVNVNLSPLGNLIPFGGFSKDLQVEIPDIELRDVNSENAQLVLEGTLDEVVSDLLGDFAGDLFKQVPEQMESDDVKGVLGDLLDKIPF